MMSELSVSSNNLPSGLPKRENKIVVIGLGNVFMKDDGVGIQVARELKQHDLGKGVLVYDYQEMDLSLLRYFQGASKVVVVDALKSGKPPGTISKYSIATREGPLLQLPSLHGLQLYDMFDLANQAGLLSCPVIIVGVEPKDCSVGEEMTEELMDALPRAVDEVIKELRVDLPKTSRASRVKSKLASSKTLLLWKHFRICGNVISTVSRSSSLQPWDSSPRHIALRGVITHGLGGGLCA